MKIDLPVELIDMKCLHCPDLNIQCDIHDIKADNLIIYRDTEVYCSHLNLCKRLKERMKKNDNT